MKIILNLTGTILLILIVGCTTADNERPQSSNSELQDTIRSEQQSFQSESELVSVSPDTIKLMKEVVFPSDDIITGQISSFAVDSQRRVFIADQDQTKIHVFSPDGRYLESLGQQGKGPAEFAAISPNTIIKVHQSRLFVPDYANSYNFFPNRIQIFNLIDLTFSHTVNLIADNKSDYSRELEQYFPKNIYPRNDGKMLVAYHRLPNEYQDDESFIRYFLQDSVGTIVSELVLEQRDRKQMVYEVTNTQVPYKAIQAFPFFGKSLIGVTTDGQFYTARSEKFMISEYDSDGEYVRSIRHPYEKLSLTRSELVNTYGEKESSRFDEGVEVKMIREAENLPENWPALNNLLVDDQNRIWVSTIIEDFDFYEWWVLKETGDLIAKFRWPGNRSIEKIKDGYLYARETEESIGLQTIVKYRFEMEV